MKLLAATAMSLFMAASASAQTDLMIARRGSQASIEGPAEYFTGSVRIAPLFQASDPSRTSGGSVTFEPGARSTHLERSHQGLENRLIRPEASLAVNDRVVQRRPRPGGMLNYYY